MHAVAGERRRDQRAARDGTHPQHGLPKTALLVRIGRLRQSATNNAATRVLGTRVLSTFLPLRRKGAALIKNPNKLDSETILETNS